MASSIYLVMSCLFGKPKPQLIEVILALLIFLFISLLMGFIVQYLAKPQTTIYQVKDATAMLELIKETLNKSKYVCDSSKSAINIGDKNAGNMNDSDSNDCIIVYSSNPQIEKYYGKVFVKVDKNTIQIKAPRIVYMKYLSFIKIQ